MKNNQYTQTIPFEDLLDLVRQQQQSDDKPVYRLDENTIVFHDDVTPESADSLIKLLHQLDREKQMQTAENLDNIFKFIDSDNEVVQRIIDSVKLSNPIHLYISTSGGDVVEAFRIINAIERLDTPVFTYADGMVASAGIWILISGEKRYSFAHNSMMLHNVLVEISGDYKNVLAKISHTDKLQEYLYDMLLSRTKLNREKIDHIFKYDYFFDAKEALELGIIDEIIGKEVKPATSKTTTTTKRSRTTTTTQI